MTFRDSVVLFQWSACLLTYTLANVAQATADSESYKCKYTTQNMLSPKNKIYNLVINDFGKPDEFFKNVQDGCRAVYVNLPNTLFELIEKLEEAQMGCIEDDPELSSPRENSAISYLGYLYRGANATPDTNFENCIKDTVSYELSDAGKIVMISIGALIMCCCLLGCIGAGCSALRENNLQRPRGHDSIDGSRTSARRGSRDTLFSDHVESAEEDDVVELEVADGELDSLKPDSTSLQHSSAAV
jgi:hypothetical protein